MKNIKFSLKRKNISFKSCKNFKNKKKYFKSSFFDIALIPIDNKNIDTNILVTQSKLCFSIPKRNIPRSVDRHQLKRYFFEFFRLNRKWIGLYDVLIICNKPIKFNKSELNLEKITNIIKNICPYLF